LFLCSSAGPYGWHITRTASSGAFTRGRLERRCRGPSCTWRPRCPFPLLLLLPPPPSSSPLPALGTAATVPFTIPVEDPAAWLVRARRATESAILRSSRSTVAPCTVPRSRQIQWNVKTRRTREDFKTDQAPPGFAATRSRDAGWWVGWQGPTGIGWPWVVRGTRGWRRRRDRGPVTGRSDL